MLECRSIYRFYDYVAAKFIAVARYAQFTRRENKRSGSSGWNVEAEASLG